MNKILRIPVLSGIIFFISGCIACPPQYEYMRSDVPPWIYKIPQEDGWVYAWGSAGRSLGDAASKKFALENARKTLAMTKGARIVHKTSQIDLFGQGVYTKVQPINDWKDLQYEVVQEWFDQTGKAGLGYQHFILIRTKDSQ